MKRLAVLPAVCCWIACLSAGAAPAFRDRTAELGIGLGNDAACCVDVDNDGWTDLVSGGAVWRNKAGKGFEKLADMGACVAADFDNDGWTDLFCWSGLKLYRNEAGKAFREVAMPPMATNCRGACWGDWNNDGFVDLYVGGFEDWDRQVTYPSYVIVNNGGKSFTITWSDATYRTRGVTACDFMRTGTPAVYASNYRLQPNCLMVGDGFGSFTNRAAGLNALATSEGFDGGHSIGAAWGDFDNDGWMDLFAGNFAHRDSRGDQPKSRYLRNTGPAAGFRFDDKGTCGVFYQESYASPAAGDYDNDGRLDLIFTAVYGVASFGVPNYPVLYRNGGSFAFTDVTTAAGVAQLPPTYQAAWADFDQDGKLDLVCGGKLFGNQAAAGSWLRVRLEGDGNRVNRSAIGAQVRVRTKDRVFTRQVEAGTGEGNQNDLTLHFGLGDHVGPVSLEVLWPGGKVQTVRRAATGRTLVVRFRG
jgi:hypothetical protein